MFLFVCSMPIQSTKKAFVVIMVICDVILAPLLSPTKSKGYSFGVVRASVNASVLLIWIWGPFLVFWR